VEFQWFPQLFLAMNTIKKFLTEAPVRRYYDVSKPITVQCDSTQSGLGVVLLQDASLFVMLPKRMRLALQK